MRLVKATINALNDVIRVFKRIRDMETAIGELRSLIESRTSDVLLALQSQRSYSEPQIRLISDFPVANKSSDHLFPRGTKNDNTRYPRFCTKLEQLFPGQRLHILDLGCSGGGMVYNFLQRGHLAIGLEGSDYSLKHQRAEWPIIPHYLKTCDITKPFRLETIDGQPAFFDVVTAWEVLEHIPEQSLPQLFKNIALHLRPGGVFAASVAQFRDFDRKTGVIWHVTLRSREWWEQMAERNGLSVLRDHPFEVFDFPRGSGNGASDWSAMSDPDKGFHLVARRADESFDSNADREVQKDTESLAD